MFKVGDKVVLNGFRANGDRHQHGTVPTIEEWTKGKTVLTVFQYDGDRDYVRAGIVFDGYGFHPSELRIALQSEIPEQKPEIPEGFTENDFKTVPKSGARVEVLHRNGGRYETTVGGSRATCWDDFEGGSCIVAYRLLDEPAAAYAFTPGQMVVCSENGTGMVFSGPDSDGDFGVAFPGARDWHYRKAHQLKPLFA